MNPDDKELLEEITRHMSTNDLDTAFRIATEGHARGSAITGTMLAMNALAANDVEAAMGFYVDAINRGDPDAHIHATEGLLLYGQTDLAEQVLIILLQGGANPAEYKELPKLLSDLARQLHASGDELRGNLWLFLARVFTPDVEAFRATGIRASEVGAFAVAGYWLKAGAAEGDTQSMMWMANIMATAGNDEGVMLWVAEAYKLGNEEAIGFVNEHNMLATHPELFA